MLLSNSQQVAQLSVILCLSITIAVQCTPLSNMTTQSTIESSSSKDDSFLSLYTMFGGGNPKTTPDGQKLVEGDMVLPEETSALGPRKATPNINIYWPNAELIYSFHESITPTERAIIESAMKHWSQNTCISFRPRSAVDQFWVRFRSDTQGCWSLVGRRTEHIGKGQDISIGQGCANLNVVVHEIGHALGLFHEQSRFDRDNHINIIWENVQEGFAMQFQKEHDNNFGVPYDLKSTMQYPQWAFSKRVFEKSTIVSINPAYQRFLSTSYDLSFRDRILANRMYFCTRSCAGVCSNGGYMRPTEGAYGNGRDCSCDCPPNFSGSRCENRIRNDYYEDLPCGGVIRQEGIIQTPNYPQRTQPGMSCMWDIHAPPGRRVSLKFNGFEFAPRFTKPGTRINNVCFNETVEIRLKNSNIYDGDQYCGTDITPGTILRSDGPRATIIITANDKMMGRGLQARVRFISSGFDETGDLDEDLKTTTSENPFKLTTKTPDEADELVSTENPFGTTQVPIFTLPPNPEVIHTLPPILPPQPPPSVATISSLLEEYEKEAGKTLPPVIPFYRQ